MVKNKVKKAQKKTEKAQGGPHPTNIYDAMIAFSNHLYNLANTGNVVGLLILAALIVVAMLAWRIPGDQIPEVIKLLLNYSHVAFPMGALAISILGNWLQWKVYNRHIRNMTEERDYLIHGLESGDLVKLNSHSSSGIDIKETHDDL